MHAWVMSNYLMKCPSCKVILVYLILMAATSASPSEENRKPTDLFIAKRNFLSRERNYLRDKPISNDLRSFIRKYKRRTLGFPRKYKRDEDDLKEHVFVVRDGNIERLENISDVIANVPSADTSGFTVIPLIIPITVKRFTNVTFCNNFTHYVDEDFPSTESVRKATDYTEIDEIKNPTKEEQTAKPNGTIFSISVSTTKVANHTNSTTTVTTTEVIVDDSTSTKSQNMKFLNKVLSDVQELISYEKEGKSSSSNEGAMCTIVGDWDSKVGGMQLQIAARNESRRSPTVELVQQEPEAESGFLKTGKWNITTLMPFNHSSLIMLTAISEKGVASFLGDCRICEGSDTITGNWMLMAKSTNCKDRQDSHSFFSDVMRKSNIRKLQKVHLDEMSTMNMTSPSSTTEL